MSKIVMRVDASSVIGHGHVMRCLSLADALRGMGSEPIFICRELEGDLIKLIQSRGYIVHAFDKDDDAQQTKRILKNIGHVDILIVDHYELDEVWEKSMRSQVNRIAVLDDLANRVHDCDVLIDPTLGRVKDDYKSLVPIESTLLLGPAYSPLSPLYSQLRYQALERRCATEKIERILVSMGGVDTDNATCFIVKALSQIKSSLSLDVVVASGWKYLSSLENIIEESHHQIQLHTDVPSLADLMLLSDLAIGAGGTTSYERCCLALPTLTVMVADNQYHNVYALQQQNAAIFLGSASEITSETIVKSVCKLIESLEAWQRLSEAAAMVCDGYGANRVAVQLLAEANALSLRPIMADDVDVIFQWQQIPGTREYARNSEALSRSEHETWFQQRLKNPDCLFNMIVYDVEPIGFIRFDRLKDKENTFEVSIFIIPQYRKKGFAAEALKLARKTLPTLEFYAEVHADNKASHQLFQSAGYVYQETGYYNYAK